MDGEQGLGDRPPRRQDDQDLSGWSPARRAWAYGIEAYRAAWRFLQQPAHVVQMLILLGVAACVALTGLRYEAIRDGRVAAERAWIAPIEVKLSTLVEDASGPRVTVSFQNVGREPALDVSLRSSAIYVAIDQPLPRGITPATAYWQTLKHGSLAKICANFQRSVEGVVYPSEAGVASQLIGFATGPALQTLDRTGLLNGSQIIVAMGCFSYRTVDGIHHSYFCSYSPGMGGRPSGSWGRFSSCPVGNEAD